MTLGPLGPAEVLDAFSTRWLITLRATEPEELRVTIWKAMKPGVIFVPDAPPSGRYWPLRCSIWAGRVNHQPIVLPVGKGSLDEEFGAMPVLV